MAEQDIRLMKGNEAMAEASIQAECDAYFGYPITPQSEVLEYLSREMPGRIGIPLQA
jgi:2-oxoglutarate ferredoxin oxidoreductase subunit alpha